MTPARTIAWCAAWLLIMPLTGHASGDARRGAQLFGQCTTCHSTVPGEHLTGPSLADIWNRPAASAAGFARYSDALKRANVTWTGATLDRWLAGPARFVPGTSMMFPGIADARAREDLIAYLQAVSEKRLPPQPRARLGRHVDLRNPPPEGRVRSIKYCGDGYTVETADGKSEKIWEFNLRFKTDSSRLGPAPGKPVAVGGGMRGDRAFVVFASPDEISAFIKRSCR